jgi:ABC-2 type transport system permease protein
VLWNFFIEVSNTGIRAVVERGDVIRKINFPKYVIILASSVSALINLLINLVVIAIFMAINHVPLMATLLLSPFLILELFIFSLGIACLLSALYVKLRDIAYIWEILAQGLFYASAVIYPVTLVLDRSPRVAEALLFNPVAQIIQDTRYAAVSHSMPTLYSISGSVMVASIPVFIAVILFACGAWYFKRQSPYFAEEV